MSEPFGTIVAKGSFGSKPTTGSRQQLAYCHQVKKVQVSVFINRDPLMGTQYLAIGKGDVSCTCVKRNWITGDLEHLDGSPYEFPPSTGGLGLNNGVIVEGSEASGKYTIMFVENKECCECASYYQSDEPGTPSGWRLHHWCPCKLGDTTEANFRLTGGWTMQANAEIKTAANKSLGQLSDCEGC